MSVSPDDEYLNLNFLSVRYLKKILPFFNWIDHIGNESEIKTNLSKNEDLASFSSVYLLIFYLR